MTAWSDPLGLSSRVVGSDTWVVVPGQGGDDLQVVEHEGTEVWSNRAAREIRINLDADTGRATRIEINYADGLTGSDLSRLPWSKLLAAADAAIRRPPVELMKTETGEVLVKDEVMETSGEALSALLGPKPKRPGRPRVPDEHYARIARRYLELRASGTTNPVAVIAKEEGAPRDTAATWVKRARAKGFLPPARPNRAG